MKIVGIITEYNPLHNGHLYHINKVKEISNCDVLVCVLSGNYVMRGNLSCIDKYNKTKFALQSGIDLVIEIPFYYVNNSSDIFAYGAVSLLNKIGVEEIYFGSETNDINYLYQIYNQTKSLDFNNKIKEELKNGISFSKAYQNALGTTINSNDILGIEYIKANEELNASIKMYTIKRENANYNDSLINNSSIQSASYIRTISNPSEFVPEYVNEYLLNNQKRDIKDLFELINHQINILSITELQEILNINEGIENRFKSNLNLDYDSFINNTITKRYNINKINRSLLNILFNFKKDDFKKVEPDYIHVLGFNEKGKKLLNMKKKEVNIFTKLPLNSTDKMIILQNKVDNLYNYKYNIENDKINLIKG